MKKVKVTRQGKSKKAKGKRSILETGSSFFALYSLLFTFLVMTPGCSSKVVPEPHYIPAVEISNIVSDLQRLGGEDLYRFPIPKDVTGINIMKATLVHLQDYEKKNPGQFSDIIQFSKATAYERLRDYEAALALYRKVAQSDGRLGVDAEKKIEALESFQEILQKPLPSQNPIEYLKGLDEKVKAWNQIIQKYQGTTYEYLARVEEERVDRAKVAFFELNRHRMKDGTQLAIIGYGQLVTKHRHSKNYYRFLLDFGDFYTLLAKEYAMQEDPEGLTFELEVFEQLAKSALKLYTEVAQVDGIIEKIEAQGKIEALRGLMEKMRKLNR